MSSILKRKFGFGKRKDKDREPEQSSNHQQQQAPPQAAVPTPTVTNQPPAQPAASPAEPQQKRMSTGEPLDGGLSIIKADNGFGGDLSHYNVESSIGKGQFSEVFQALHLRTKQKVALKRISIFEMLDAKARLDCIKEINLLQQLDHPNVVKHLSSFIDKNDLYIVLELADGGDLAKLIRYFKKNRQLMKEPLIWKYFGQICDALEHMHSKRVMHRDIKPANVFMTSKGVVKLGDLGLGRFFNTGSVRAESLVGTPYYMSPERIHENGYDFKSDIWSLGCLLYEMAVLQSPFYGEKMNLYTLCQKIDSGSYAPLPSDLFSMPLRSIVTSCLQVDPAQRPTISDICQQVRQVTGQPRAQPKPTSFAL